MSEDDMLKLLICFILGYLASRMMGNGFSVGGEIEQDCGWVRYCDKDKDCSDTLTKKCWGTAQLQTQGQQYRELSDVSADAVGATGYNGICCNNSTTPVLPEQVQPE